MWGIHVLLLLAAGLVLADASVVTLALPPVIAELDASVEQAAAVLGVYTFVLAVALPLVVAAARAHARGGRRAGVRRRLGRLRARRLDRRRCSCCAACRRWAGRRCWSARSRCSTPAARAGASGRRWRSSASPPARRSAARLTQAFDWRAIFLAQVPIALAAAIVAFVDRHGRQSRQPTPARLLQCPGFAGPADGARAPLRRPRRRPLPARAAARHRLVGRAAGRRRGGHRAADRRGPRRARARSRRACGRPPGALLVAGGVLALAFLPGASLWWTVLPQAMAGAGLGLALPALAGELLPEDTAEQAANLLAIRHAGITVALILLAPVAAAQLDDAVDDTRIKGAALVLDARLPPLEKLSLAGTLLADIDPVDPRGQLEAGLAGADGRPRGPRRLRRARHARRRDARGRRAGRLRAGLRDLRRARAAGRAGARPARPPRARRRRRGRRAGRRRRARPAGARARARHARRPVPARATCRAPAGSRARSRTSRWWRSTAPPAASAPRARSSRWRSSTPTRAPTTSASTASTRAASAGCSAACSGSDLVPWDA